MAAGISVTWYTWIEQGRPVSCSRDTLERIAGALRMDSTERKHLFELAPEDEAAHPPTFSTTAPPDLVPIVDAMAFHPAYVINGFWDVLHFNAACAAVLGPFEAGSPTRGNVLRRLFLDDAWRRGFGEWETTACFAVAQFRSATARFVGVEAFHALVTGLADESPAFRAMWESKRLASPPLKRKTFFHPTLGRLVLHYASLRPAGVPDDVTLVLYVPPPDALDAVRTLVATRLP